MARDTKRNAYFCVGIPKNSPIYEALMQDAEQRGISPSTLIGIRAGDFYKYGIQTAQAKQVEASPSAQSEPVADAASVSDEVVPPLDEEEEREAANALAALDAW